MICLKKTNHFFKILTQLNVLHNNILSLNLFNKESLLTRTKQWGFIINTKKVLQYDIL